MKQTIENNVVSISVGTALTVISSVIIMVWNVAGMKDEFKDTNAKFNTRLTVMEERNLTEKDYIKGLKGDIEKNNKKLNAIYNLLINKGLGK